MTAPDLRALRARIQVALAEALSVDRLHGTPRRLQAAVQHAVFPGGGRVRPLLTLVTAEACGAGPALNPLVEAAATAVELLHCASLVHDDLPCFDDSQERRGRPSVHAQFGESLAVLAGDALIVHAFDLLAAAGERHPARALAMVRILAAGVGMPGGIVAGQAWEAETRIDRVRYHQAKTGALFEAALALGAAAAGAEQAPWRVVGQELGAAYQVADDLLDVIGQAREEGKPVGQDARFGRPNAVADLGLDGAFRVLGQALDAAEAAVPHVPGRAAMVGLLDAVGRRLLPMVEVPLQQHDSRAAVG